MKRKATMLTPSQLHRLDLACSVIAQAFDSWPYLVGSALHDPDWRDVDVRLILADDEFERLDSRVRILLNLTTATWLEHMTGLPIDFQIQQQTGANRNHAKRRNPLGTRTLENFSGDWDTPAPEEGE